MKELTHYQDYFPVFSKNKLFENIDPADYENMFSYLHASIRQYDKDECLQLLQEPFRASGIVLDGAIEGSFFSENYDKINVDHFDQGKIFGVALSCVQVSNSPIQLRALTNCTILFLDLHVLFTATQLDALYKQQLSINLIRLLATQNIFSNLKLRIASQKVMRDRILLYLQSLTPDSNGNLHLPFTRTALAEFLGVNRSALSRELGRMQDEGLLRIEDRLVKILSNQLAT